MLYCVDVIVIYDGMYIRIMLGGEYKGSVEENGIYEVPDVLRRYSWRIVVFLVMEVTLVWWTVEVTDKTSMLLDICIKNEYIFIICVFI